MLPVFSHCRRVKLADTLETDFTLRLVTDDRKYSKGGQCSIQCVRGVTANTNNTTTTATTVTTATTSTTKSNPEADLLLFRLSHLVPLQSAE